MRAATTIRRGPVQRATRRPPGRLDSHRRWTGCRGLVTGPNITITSAGRYLYTDDYSQTEVRRYDKINGTWSVIAGGSKAGKLTS